MPINGLVCLAEDLVISVQEQKRSCHGCLIGLVKEDGGGDRK